MSKTLSSAAFAATLSLAMPAMAQMTPPGAAVNPAPSTAPAAASSSDPAASAPVGAGADVGATASATASLSSGMSVKDNSGAIIGEITGLKADPSGKQVATIKMGSDAFSVETDRLAVKDGSAMINASQAELKAMLKK